MSIEQFYRFYFSCQLHFYLTIDHLKKIYKIDKLRFLKKIVF